MNPVTTGLDPDEGTPLWYRRMFELCVVRDGSQHLLDQAVKAVLAGEAVYRVTEKLTGVPWQVIGAIHFKEADCDMKACLHNGEHIIGTTRKTTLVPAGRGPFKTWQEAAVDAISTNPHRWAALKSGGNDIGEILFAIERYNGTGYISGAGRQETSPYLWAGSNVNDGSGKFTGDHHFDPDATTLKTVGAALVLKVLAKTGHFDLHAVINA